MIPTMSSMTLLRTRVEKSSMRVVTVSAPMSAAVSTAANPIAERVATERLPPRTSITVATPRAAPDVIPNMSGPASGLRKVVCRSSPLAESAAPARSAVSAWGSRLSRMMYLQLWRPSNCPRRMSRMSAGGMCTEPAAILAMNRTTMAEMMRRVVLGTI